MVTPLPPAALGTNALALVAGAAADPALGENASWQGTVTTAPGPGLNPVSTADERLTTTSSDQAWRNSWLLVTSVADPVRDVLLGAERFVYAVEANAGVLRWVQPLPTSLVAGDGFLLLRDFRFARWLDWLNETARNLHYPLDVVVPASADANQVRYPLPAPLQRAGWVEEIWVRQAPTDSRAEATIPAGTEVRWYRVDAQNVAGDAYVTLPRPLGTSQELVFRARPPFAYEGQTPYAKWDDVLVPAGNPAGESVLPPVRLFQMGVTWRALQAKLTPLTGQPRALWLQNLERFARRYAEACEEWKQKDEQRVLGYREDWFPQGTAQAWSLP